MTPENRKLLRKNYVELLEIYKPELLPLCNILEQEGIITKPMKEAVLSKTTDQTRGCAFLDLVERRGPHAFNVLYEASKQLNLFSAADILYPGNSPHEPNDDDDGELYSENIMETDSGQQSNNSEEPWPSPQYINEVENLELTVKKITNKTQFSHRSAESFYPMVGTKKKTNKVFLFWDKDSPLEMDMKAIDDLVGKLNFLACRRIPVRDFKDNEFLKQMHLMDDKTECVLLFVYASGFLKDKNNRLLLMSIIKKHLCQNLGGIPKIVFRYESVRTSPCVQSDNNGSEQANEMVGNVKECGVKLKPDLQKQQHISPDIFLNKNGDKDSHDGPSSLAVAEDADFSTFESKSFGNEVINFQGKELTRFIHRIVYVLCNHAKDSEFTEILGKVNDLKEENGVSGPVGIMGGSLSKKLYFFPGFQD